MLAVYVLYLATLGCRLCTTDAAVTAWTNPVIATASGSGTSTQTIPENQPVGATPVTIAATASGTKAYAITSQPTPGKLTITPSTGKLNLAAGYTFDYETLKTYVLTITCVDGASTGTATVTLNITDINDVSPVFAIPQSFFTISNGATAGTAVTTVTATDADTVGSITYSILAAGNTNTDFSISSSGAITVATGKTISMATTNGYLLTVQATDTVTTPGTSKVIVVVQTCSSGTTAIIAGGIAMLVVTTALLF